jgi:hypothetical protein
VVSVAVALMQVRGLMTEWRRLLEAGFVPAAAAGVRLWRRSWETTARRSRRSEASVLWAAAWQQSRREEEEETASLSQRMLLQNGASLHGAGLMDPLRLRLPAAARAAPRRVASSSR